MRSRGGSLISMFSSEKLTQWSLSGRVLNPSEAFAVGEGHLHKHVSSTRAFGRTGFVSWTWTQKGNLTTDQADLEKGKKKKERRGGFDHQRSDLTRKWTSKGVLLFRHYSPNDRMRGRKINYDSYMASALNGGTGTRVVSPEGKVAHSLTARGVDIATIRKAIKFAKRGNTAGRKVWGK